MLASYILCICAPSRQKHQTALQNSNAGGFFYVFQITRARRMQKRRIEEERTCEREENLVSSSWWCKVCAAIFYLMSALLTEGNAKCCHLKKLTCKGTLRQVFEAQNTIPPPPLRTVYIRVYSILNVFTQGRGEGGNSWTSEKVRWATVHKAESKIPR